MLKEIQETQYMLLSKQIKQETHSEAAQLLQKDQISKLFLTNSTI